MFLKKSVVAGTQPRTPLGCFRLSPDPRVSWEAKLPLSGAFGVSFIALSWLTCSHFQKYTPSHSKRLCRNKDTSHNVPMYKPAGGVITLMGKR